MKKVELLAPAGSFDAFLVALEAGADAVYISGKTFGARAFAPNFSLEEIKEAVRYAHILGKKVFVTLNTLIYDSEIEEVTNYINYLYDIKVDALIVQDLGVVNLVKSLHPDFILHASTQMSIYNETGIDNLKKLGISRAILARELTIDEVTSLTKHNMEIEIFVHGALCYAYSGNCLMSYAIGKRSGNRGACAQPCRKKYSLYENDKVIKQDKNLLSMKDLMTIDNIDQIIKSGVTSLKIEGRMKSLEYVRSVVSIYRKKIDEYYLNKLSSFNVIDDKKIKVTFNRGFTKGYLLNDLNINRTTVDTVNHIGIYIGKVIKKVNKKVTINLIEDLNINDGIKFKGNNEVGAYVNEIFLNNNLVKYAKAGSTVTLILNTPCNVNDEVYKTVDSILASKAMEVVKSFPLKRSISMKAFIKLNEPMRLVIYSDNIMYEYKHDILKELANNPIANERIITQLSKLNDTLFTSNNILVEYDKKAFFTIKQLNELRRNAIKEFENILINNCNRCNLPIIYDVKQSFEQSQDNNDYIEVIVQNEEQQKACKELGIYNIYFKENYLERFSKKQIDRGMIHNLGQFKSEVNNLVPSIYFNILNSQTISLLYKMGFNKCFLSSELDVEDVKHIDCNLLKVGYFIYGKEDVMVSNQCFIASCKGFDNKKCGSCIKNSYYLIDEYNNKFTIKTDLENCHIRILNSKVRNEISSIKKLLNFDVKKLLVIFNDENSVEIKTIINTINKEIKKCIS